ncbi:MAG TPA: S41 family peptidase, partial [Gemmatimonadaceae bacterium]
TNWDDFLIRGVRAVEGAPNADSLARTMTALFANVAPQVRIVAGAPPRVPAQRPDLGARLGVAYWSNTGLMLGAPNSAMPNIYSSVLVVSPALDGHLPPGLPSPDSAWTATLGGGVSAVVPTALWTTLPDDESARRKPVTPSLPAQESLSPSDRAARIVGVITAWNVFEHSYPYFDIVGVDWNAELPRALETAATDPTPTDYLGTLRRLVAAAHDGHGNVYPLSGMTRRGYLPVALDWVENQLVVTRVGDGAPGDIKRGDVIESIDGVKSLDVLRKREEQISGATPQWLRYRSVNEVMLGDSGAVLDLRLASGRNVKLSFSSLSAVTDPRPEKIAEIRPGIYYVDIDRITNEDFNAALPKLVQARGVVFDMRGYPRQVSTPMILSRLSSDTIRSAHFEAPTFPYPDRRGVQYNRDGGWVLPPLQPRIPGKIAFLTGGGAISYAESTMGIVEQFKLGEIVGSTSAGTNGNVNPFTVMGAYSIAYTGMRVRKLDNTPHHGVGIKPTIPVPRTIRGVTAGRDEALDRAIIAVGGAPIVP